MTKRLGVFILSISLLVSCSKQEPAGFITKLSTNNGLTCQIPNTKRGFSIKAIYGVDNRLDWHESPGQTKEYWAKATLALIPSYSVIKREEGYEVLGTDYEDEVGLCAGHPFAKQPAAGFCSGFLVSEDLVVTAGHCVRSIGECHRTKFVFDFAKQFSDQEDYHVDDSAVYSCSEIVKREAETDDFAVIRLDRPVEGRTPLNLRRQGVVGVGEQVMLIGHPMGLPSKIADGGFVQSAGNVILATVDAFAANSGSVILNSQTGLVEGILVAGEPDYKYQGGCRVEAVCGAGCSGEVITPISKVLPYIPDIDYDNPVCD